LFLDDFEVLVEKPVLQLVRQLILHLPAHGMLVLASRSLPEIGLGRLRAMGRLMELGENQLRFSDVEAHTFLNERRRLELTHEQIAQLQHKTGGWIAAMGLASSVLAQRHDRDQFINDFSGSDRLLAQYLTEDVFDSLQADLQIFLLSTCITEEFDLPLCVALTQRGDSRDILEQLQAANLFITALGGEVCVYRYHSLFRQFLRNKLNRDRPGDKSRLHLVAARWYESAGHHVHAIEHFLEGGHVEQACRLLGEAAEYLLQSGRMRLLDRWFSMLPESAWRDSAYLGVVRIWAMCFTRGPWEAMGLLDAIGSQADYPDASVRNHVLALRPTLLVMMDKVEEAYAAGTEALRHMPDRPSFASIMLANEMAYILLLMGEQRQSLRMLNLARDRSGVGQFHNMYSESIEGIIDLEEGRMREAASRFRIAAISDPSLGPDGASSAWAGILNAGIHYQRNDLESAERLLQIYLPLARELGMVDHLIAGYRMLARVAAAQGDMDQAFQRLAELEQVGQQRRLKRVVCGAKLERARMLLMQGNLEGARDELDRAKDREVWERERRLRLPAHDVEYWELGDLRWQIFGGRGVEASTRLAQLVRTATAEKRHRRALKMNILRCLQACDSRTRITEMLPLMESVLRTACAEGLVRTLVDEGERVLLMVRLVLQGLDSAGKSANDLAFRQFLQNLCAQWGPDALDLVRPGDAPEFIPLEPLTPKEIRILRLLAHGHPNSALAEKLFVSVNTVRTHLRHINSKLGVNNRTEAVAVARKMGLLKF
jgi:LuxR family maltose regulon positive regulatory protein